MHLLSFEMQHGGLLTAYRNPQPILRPSPLSSPTLTVPVSLVGDDLRFFHHMLPPTLVPGLLLEPYEKKRNKKES